MIIDQLSMSSFDRMLTAFQNASFLGLNVALVMIPGLYLTAVLKEEKIILGIANRFKTINIEPAAKILIMSLGLLPAIESLTGFGVSLFLSVPLLLEIFSEDKGQKLALLGMNIMPWGTLGLATTLGATLIDVSPSTLGIATAITSIFVFPIFGFMILYVAGGWVAVKKWSFLNVIQCVLLSSFLYVNARYISVETAGVISGLSVSVLLLSLFRLKKPLYETAAQEYSWVYLLKPYITVFLLIILMRSFPFVWNILNSTLTIRNNHITFAPLTSPGIPLLLVALFLQIKNLSKISLTQILKRAKKPLITTFLFLVLAQFMYEFGVINIISDNVSRLGITILWFLSPLAGLISGFVTGSNVGGNVLFMQIQYKIGALHHYGILFAAIQNASAGFAVFASMPIIMLVQALSNDNKPSTTQTLVKFTLWMLPFLYVGLILGFWLLSQVLTYTHLIPG